VREEEGPRFFGRSFLYHLELGKQKENMSSLGSSRRELGGGTLESRGGTVPDYLLPRLSHS
jgi:hypothetical protein